MRFSLNLFIITCALFCKAVFAVGGEPTQTAATYQAEFKEPTSHQTALYSSCDSDNFFNPPIRQADLEPNKSCLSRVEKLFGLNSVNLEFLDRFQSTINLSISIQKKVFNLIKIKFLMYLALNTQRFFPEKNISHS